MNKNQDFLYLSPTLLVEGLTRKHVMDIGIRPIWEGMPRVAGPAYPVRCPNGDNLMLHAAIHRAEPGTVIIVESEDDEYAVAGGNVCAVAQKRGIAALVVDGVVRDLAEIRKMRFPVFARGISPIPGKKEQIGILNGLVTCGGVQVFPGDMLVGDEEGIVVIPQSQLDVVFKKAQARAAQDEALSLEAWERAHKDKIQTILKTKGFIE